VKSLRLLTFLEDFQLGVVLAESSVELLKFAMHFRAKACQFAS
jgi:hypothetical protein